MIEKFYPLRTQALLRLLDIFISDKTFQEDIHLIRATYGAELEKLPQFPGFRFENLFAEESQDIFLAIEEDQENLWEAALADDTLTSLVAKVCETVLAWRLLCPWGPGFIIACLLQPGDDFPPPLGPILNVARTEYCPLAGASFDLHL